MLDVRNEIPTTIVEIMNNLDELLFWYTKEKTVNIIKKVEEKKNEECC